jgi:2-polyprenyl-6-methoxyphenol hydroxylase-like FAD-dependent oxidoreductase
MLAAIILLISFISSFAIKTKVLIAGGGPAGLFTAQALLSRNKDYEVHIHESKGDPRYATMGPRAYSLGLNIRGQSAFKYFESKNRSKGLWSNVLKEGVESDSFFLHIGQQKFHIRKPTPPSVKSDPETPPPTLLIQRNRLCAAMLSYLEYHYASTGQFRIHFDSKLKDVSLGTRQVILENDKIEDYDMLIGADGVNSIVRTAMINWEEDERRNTKVTTIVQDNTNQQNMISSLQGFETEEVILPGQYKVMVQPTPPTLEPDAVHSMVSKSSGKKNEINSQFSLFSIPAAGNQTCTLISWRHYPQTKPSSDSTTNHMKNSDIPTFLQEGSTIEEIQEAIASTYPQYGAPSETAILQLFNQSPSEARTVRCNRYHHQFGRALLLGDSAHSTGGTLVSYNMKLFLSH